MYLFFLFVCLFLKVLVSYFCHRAGWGRCYVSWSLALSISLGSGLDLRRRPRQRRRSEHFPSSSLAAYNILQRALISWERLLKPSLRAN